MTPAPQYRPTWPCPSGVPLTGHHGDRFRNLLGASIGARIARRGAPFTFAEWLAECLTDEVNR